eukprot:1869204-Pyramimonas_sp.AAC.1
MLCLLVASSLPVVFSPTSSLLRRLSARPSFRSHPSCSSHILNNGALFSALPCRHPRPNQRS